jgi:hypothetical protein
VDAGVRAGWIGEVTDRAICVFSASVFLIRELMPEQVATSKVTVGARSSMRYPPR